MQEITGFSTACPVEKPVENVDNFCEKPVRGLWKENLCSANKCVRMKSQCGKNIRSFFPNKISPGGLQKPYLNRYNKSEISNQYIGELKKKGKENEKDLGSIAGNGPGTPVIAAARAQAQIGSGFPAERNCAWTATRPTTALTYNIENHGKPPMPGSLLRA